MIRPFLRSSKPVLGAGFDCHLCIKLVAFKDALNCAFDLIIAFCSGYAFLLEPKATTTSSSLKKSEISEELKFRK